MKRPQVLSTKGLDPQLVARAKDAGIDIREEAFITVTPIRTETKKMEVARWLNTDIGLAVFTSAHAVAEVAFHLSESGGPLPGWQLACISGKTRQSAEALFPPDRVVATAPDAARLAAAIIALGVPEVLFFCGNLRRDTLPHRLQEAGIKVREVVVYETEARPIEMQDSPDAVLFFSPSGVDSFFSSNELPAGAACFAIGPATAAAVAACTDNELIVSEAPDPQLLLEAVLAYFKPIE